jgi:hypothetical protein
MENLSSGLPWILVTVLGVAALAAAFIYGTLNWRQKREANLPGPATAPGPTPKSDENRPDNRPRAA